MGVSDMARGRGSSKDSGRDDGRGRTSYEKKLSKMPKSEKKLGAGGRSKALAASISSGKNPPEDVGAVVAAIGRKKFGKAKFQKLAKAGKKGKK